MPDSPAGATTPPASSLLDHLLSVPSPAYWAGLTLGAALAAVVLLGIHVVA